MSRIPRVNYVYIYIQVILSKTSIPYTSQNNNKENRYARDYKLIKVVQSNQSGERQDIVQF